VLLLAAVLSVPQVARAQVPPPGRGSSVGAVLEPFLKSHALAGAVTLVADKDKVLSLEAAGYADVAAGKPMRPDTLFWIASQSKSMTATALMMLVDDGKVKLDDPVEKFLPEFKNQWLAVERDREHVLLKKPKHTITVRNILSHTSGMPHTSAMEEPTLDRLRLRDAVRSYAMTPLQFEPDSKYQYSNAGINTAGCIIQVVSGLLYEDFMQKHLFEPLGMKDTTFWPNAEQLARLAKSYRMNSDKSDLEETTVSQLEYPLNDRKRQPMPAGGLFSTAGDVCRFCQMIANGGVYGGKRIVSPAAVAEMTRKQTADSIQTGYGLGWTTGDGTYGHGGAYGTSMTVDSKRGLITLWMVQDAGNPKSTNESRAAFNKAVERWFGSPKT
jgi:CubicO group peptidase (beta-lactamase class C family)